MGLFRSKKPAVTVGPVTTVKHTIAVINSSTVMTDAEIAPIVQAMQVAISRDFAPIWGQDAALVQIPQGGTPPTGAWWCVILDDAPSGGYLGYHDLTPEDLPIMKIFAGTDKKYGNEVSVTLAHEIWEALGDPTINKCIQTPDGNFMAYENADACEDDSLAYLVNNVKISDFVFPSWFDANAKGQVDFCNHLTKPFQLSPGGYIGIWTQQSGWTQLTAQAADTKTLISSRGQVGSRRERRRTPRHQWVRSTATGS